MNMKNKYLIGGLILMLYTIVIVSCTQDIQPGDDSDSEIISTNFRSYFDAFWKGMNKNYVFWDIETNTDWDKVYKDYAPKFDTLRIGNEQHEKIAGRYFKEILRNLKDSHYSTTFYNFYGMNLNDTIINGVDFNGRQFSPSLFRKVQDPNFYKGSLLDSNIPDLYADLDFSTYLDADNRYRAITPDPAGGPKSDFVMSGTINKNILFIKFSGFFMYQKYNTDQIYQKVLNFYFKTLKEAPNNGIKGVIFDVRENGGGDLSDLNFLIGRFVDTPTVIGYQHYKNGDNRLDYTPWMPFYVKPPLESDPSPKKCTVPVIVLTDAYSVSMSEISTMAIKAISPLNKSVGEKTWGAMGGLNAKGNLTGGQFKVGQLSFTYTSSAATVNKEYKSYEGNGIPVDVEVKYDKEALKNGIDKQLEAAIKLIN
jgi:carboxyl-terminal processing protease